MKIMKSCQLQIFHMVRMMKRNHFIRKQFKFHAITAAIAFVLEEFISAISHGHKYRWRTTSVDSTHRSRNG